MLMVTKTKRLAQLQIIYYIDFLTKINCINFTFEISYEQICEYSDTWYSTRTQYWENVNFKMSDKDTFY